MATKMVARKKKQLDVALEACAHTVRFMRLERAIEEYLRSETPDEQARARYKQMQSSWEEMNSIRKNYAGFEHFEKQVKRFRKYFENDKR